MSAFGVVQLAVLPLTGAAVTVTVTADPACPVSGADTVSDPPFAPAGGAAMTREATLTIPTYQAEAVLVIHGSYTCRTGSVPTRAARADGGRDCSVGFSRSIHSRRLVRECGLEVVLVLAEVVAAAAQLQVVEVAGSVLGPVLDVVAVAVVGGERAAGFDAGSVPEAEGPAL